jgi:hypothetical protein
LLDAKISVTQWLCVKIGAAEELAGWNRIVDDLCEVVTDQCLGKFADEAEIQPHTEAQRHRAEQVGGIAVNR